VDVHVRPADPIEFALNLRLPQDGVTKIRLNGHPVAINSKNGFALLNRRWVAGDTVQLEFAMKPRVIEGFEQSVSIMRGPLVFSLPLQEKWTKLHDRGLTADWTVTSESPWNYGLTKPADMSVTEHAIGDIPFAKLTPPVTLQTQAVRIENWGSQDGVAGDSPKAPNIDMAKAEAVTLVPYASTKLRITALPLLNNNG